MTVLLKTWAVTAFKQTHTHPFNGPFPGLLRWASTRKVTPIWILLKQETVSGSGISWAICMSAPYSRQTTTPAPHHSVFLQAGCPSCWATNSIKTLKANRQTSRQTVKYKYMHFGSQLLLTNSKTSSIKGRDVDNLHSHKNYCQQSTRYRAVQSISKHLHIHVCFTRCYSMTEMLTQGGS